MYVCVPAGGRCGRARGPPPRPCVVRVVCCVAGSDYVGHYLFRSIEALTPTPKLNTNTNTNTKH